jgi:hypothetical protein
MQRNEELGHLFDTGKFVMEVDYQALLRDAWRLKRALEDAWALPVDAEARRVRDIALRIDLPPEEP